MTDAPDYDAIAEDVEMAIRSTEMARHVALDHTPALIARCRELEGRVARVRELRDHYRTLGDSQYHADDLTAILDSKDPSNGDV